MSLNHELSPSQTVATIKRILGVRHVPIIRSSPGLGKSDIVRALAKEYRLKVIDIRLSQSDVTDLNGLPFRTDKGKAKFLPFEHFPLEGDELPDHPDGGKYNGWLLFFDEITSAGKQMQAASYKVLLEKLMGNTPLHEDVYLCCAGNKKSDKAVTHEMSTALQRRLIHVNMRYDHRDFMAWGAQNGIDSRILAFLEFKPENGHKFDPDHTDHTFACPATWEFASDLIKGTEVTMADVPLLAGTVSAGVALEFASFCAVYANLPQVSDILANPKTAPVPQEASTKYAMSTHLADKMDASNVDAFVEYINRYPVEFRVITLRMINDRHPQFLRNPTVMALAQQLVTNL